MFGSIKKMSVTSGVFFGALLAWSFFPFNASAHCEIPCGIYDDDLRFQIMLEHVETIAKAVSHLKARQDLQAASPAHTDITTKGDDQKEMQSQHQATRWIISKEKHATEIQGIVSQYFLTQRLKPQSPKMKKNKHYAPLLAQFHEILVLSMKAKQSATPDLKKLENTIRAVQKRYPKYVKAHAKHKH